MWHHPRTSEPHLQTHGLPEQCVVEREESNNRPFVAFSAVANSIPMAVPMLMSMPSQVMMYGADCFMPVQWLDAK